MMTDWSLIEMTWPHWRSQALLWWDRLTDSEWEELNGHREKLIELLMVKYGWSHDQAEQEVRSRFAEFTPPTL